MSERKIVPITPLLDPSGLKLIARILRRLTYQEMLALSTDLLSDSDSLGKTPIEVADLLARWAERQMQDPEQASSTVV